MAQFMPKFVIQKPYDNKIKYTIDEDDVEDDITSDNLNHKLAFIFIVDRSGSMSNGIRMEMTRKSLILFM